MNRKGPWEGCGRQRKPVVSFPPSFARTFSSRERRLATRQLLPSSVQWFLKAGRYATEGEKPFTDLIKNPEHHNLRRF